MSEVLACAQKSAVSAAPPTAATHGAIADLPRLLLGADLHGCKLEVVACPNPLLVGRKGIVAQVCAALIFKK